jgi:hypothetical protein
MSREPIAELNALADPSQQHRLKLRLKPAWGPISAVRISYPDVPEIEFGEKTDPRAWIVGPEASDWWLLDSTGEQILTSEMDDAAERLKTELAGGAVQSLGLSGALADLAVRLDDGRTLLIESKTATDLPAWKLFTPERRVLSAGPGPFWADYRSDIPTRLLPWRSEPRPPTAVIAESAEGREASRRWRATGQKNHLPGLAIIATALLVGAAVAINLAPDTAIAISNVLVGVVLLVIVGAFLRSRL